MSLDKQVALARTLNIDSTNLNKATRLIVAPFLQKLYEIVNDPKTDELIRWSDDGDSFYVLNHERFAREVLGHWFKHQKFTSFVRQLNMYGFHKIPHLQQGVLRSDTDTEAWHFEHPNFRRGQPDLLTFITRKTKSTHGNVDEAQLDYNETVNVAPQVGTLSAGQVLDINSVVHGIQAIKRHQQAISADLNALKQSNDLLWKEAEITRQRHDKHQDTINRILKFLAGVFGNSADPKDGSRSPSAVVPVARQRLMISDGRPKGKAADVGEDDRGSVQTPQSDHDARHLFPIDQIAAIDEQSQSIASSAAFSPVSLDSPATYISHTSIRPDMLSRSPTASGPNSGSNSSNLTSTEVPTPDGCPQPQESTLSPSALTSFTPPPSQSDGLWQAAIQQMLNSPDQMQRLMQMLASQQNHPMRGPSSPSTGYYGLSSQVMQYDPNQNDYSRYRPDIPPAPHPSLPLLGPQLQNDAPSLGPLLDDAQRLQRTYRDAAEIEADMDVLQTSLNSLIQNLGIDPHSIVPQAHDQDELLHNDEPPHNNVASTSTGIPMDRPTLSGLEPHDDPSSDLFLDALLSGINAGGGEYPDVTGRYDPSTEIDGTKVGDASTEQLTAFLDEVSDTASPLPPHSPDSKPTNGGYKRKLDMADLSIPQQKADISMTVPKVKRKR
ncbi:hypothetical protein SCP_0402620 [Sparassis crispa]|uniref:HSF-type DNA-binding domain-containing protein n=1 Tax=Sparassis crispa TaxID=139825 RepID=A0A401GIA2_9APHY|nr:hypothetical protein SCP_0402620 [Sparassis crispa]GBE81888.1 hypothetical protein SCP_0402620 [Sparassis crispa]